MLADRIGASRVSLFGMILLSLSLFSLALAPTTRIVLPVGGKNHNHAQEVFSGACKNAML
jgi:MFS family permease